MHQYSRAERLLTRPFPTSPPTLPLATSMSINGNDNPFAAPDFKGKGRAPDQYLPDPMSLNKRIPMSGSGEMINLATEYQDGVSRLVDMSVACRYLAAQCQMRQGKWADATEMLGEANPFRGSNNSGPNIPNVDGGIKVRISCYSVYYVSSW